MLMMILYDPQEHIFELLYLTSVVFFVRVIFGDDNPFLFVIRTENSALF